MLRAPGDTTGAAVQLLAPSRRAIRPSPSSLTVAAPACSSWRSASTDVAAACDALRAKGLRVLFDEPKRGTADSRVNFVHPKDAGGVLVELVQPAPGH